jgi:hypothetical protein
MEERKVRIVNEMQIIRFSRRLLMDSLLDRASILQKKNRKEKGFKTKRESSFRGEDLLVIFRLMTRMPIAQIIRRLEKRMKYHRTYQ